MGLEKHYTPLVNPGPDRQRPYSLSYLTASFNLQFQVFNLECLWEPGKMEIEKFKQEEGRDRLMETRKLGKGLIKNKRYMKINMETYYLII